jgi:FixJ family two-component response regulator
MAEGDLSQRNRARRCSCAPTASWTRTEHRYIRQYNSRRDRIRPSLLNDDIYCRDPALPHAYRVPLASNRAVEALPAGRASCRVGTTPVKLAVHPIPGVSLRYWHPLTESPTVFVIDDDADVRTSIEGLLEEAGFRAISFEKAEDFLRDARFDGPGCIILDVSLPGISGLDFQQQLRKAGVRTPIIFLTAHGDIPMTVTALKSGAVEFFTKPIDDEELLRAIQQALARDRAIRQKDAGLADLRRRYETLTPRERQVMNLVVSGLLNKQIASELGTSLITIKVHRAQVMHKMQAESLPDLVRMTEKLQLIRQK